MSLVRNIINALITLGVFWISKTYFSEYLTITDTKTLILATAFMFVIGYIFSFAMLISVLTIPLGIGCITTIVLFLVALVLTPIKLWLLDSYLAGFDIHGFWSYVILTVVLSIFSIKAKSKKSEDKK